MRVRVRVHVRVRVCCMRVCVWCVLRERQRDKRKDQKKTVGRVFFHGNQSCFLVKQARLVCWDHVLDVDERVLPTVLLKGFQGFIDEIADVLPLLLTVVNAIPAVEVLLFENVEDREDLTVIRHQRLSNEVARIYQLL